MRRNKLFGWLTGFASIALAAGTSMAPVLAAVGENMPENNTGPVEEVVDGEADVGLDSTGQDKGTEKKEGKDNGSAADAAPQANGEAEKGLDGTIARGANDGTGSTEASGVYDFKDNKTTGTVTIIKKWEDKSNNTERPTVDMSLSTTKPSKNPLGYTVTFHADAAKGLTFADGSTENEVVYNSSGQVVSGAYQGLTGGSGVVRWYTDKTYQTPVGLNADGTLTTPLTGDADVWPKEVTFEIKGGASYNNGFNQKIPSTVTTVVFTDEAMPADTALIDVDDDGDGGVVAWTEENGTVMKVSTQMTGVKVQAAKNSRTMFYNKSNITSIDFTNFDTSKVTRMDYMFSGCSNLTSLDVYSFDTSKVTSMEYMFSGCSRLTSLDVSSFDTSQMTSMDSMFQSCGKLTILNLSSFDASKVTNMNNMFRGCSGLTSLNLSSFDTSQVTNMYSMFYNCNKLTSLDVSSFDTSKITNMGSMFYNCSKLTSLDVYSFDTSQVTNMSNMFSGCSGLTSLNVSSFDTSQVTRMDSMFRNCSSLTSLDVLSLNTSKVTNMDSMFNGCRKLTSLNLSSFDTSKVTRMGYMFSSCSRLTNLDVSSFDTSQVTRMNWMFYGCSGLTSLNVLSFDTSKVTNMEYMFSDCSGLTTITTGANFQFVGTDYNLSGTWRNTAGETFTSGTFPSNVADTYTKIAS